MDLKNIKEIIEANQLRTIILIGTDSCNVQRGKRVPVAYFYKIAESGISFASYILYTTMMDEVLPGLFDTGIPVLGPCLCVDALGKMWADCG